MSFAFFAVASVVAAGGSLDSAAGSVAESQATETAIVAPEANAGAGLDDTSDMPVVQPLRFDTGLRPLIALPQSNYVGTPAGGHGNHAKAAPPASVGAVKRFGNLSDLKERVELIADQYDAAVWRPIPMDGGGGGVQYRLKFGAKDAR